jgi:hypothetical protein
MTSSARQLNAIRNFVLSGAELTGAAKERFALIQELNSARNSAKTADGLRMRLLTTPPPMMKWKIPEDVL